MTRICFTAPPSPLPIFNESPIDVPNTRVNEYLEALETLAARIRWVRKLR